MPSYALFNRLNYFSHLIAEFNKAGPGDTIVLTTMEFRPDQPAINNIADALCKAAQNGAKVTFLVDAYSFMLKPGTVLGPLFFSKKDPRLGYGEFKPVVEAVHRLRANNVNCVVINKPQRPLKNPFGGRSHIKFAVINEEVFIGGCNLSHPEQLDVMVRTHNAKLASYMLEFTADVIYSKSVRRALCNRDVGFKIDDETELLIDAGVKRQSLIYKRAFELINSAASRVYMTCQYFPNIRTPAELAKAHDRGVAVHLAYNHPDQHRLPIRGIQKRTLAYKKKRLPSSVFKNQLNMDSDYLHAKILLSEKEVIVGSHNFVKMGVNLGTAEIALRSTSKDFIRTARNWITAL
ncbi:MAG: phospholipase D-like domain-containing protein [Candidatus Saccharimonadales bacterium]